MTRLDVYLVREGYFDSRQRAQDAVRAGAVLIDGRIADKPSRPVGPGNTLAVRRDAVGYVSRGGIKLEKALDAFGIAVEGKVFLDAGASTGGFTQCLLERGAERVYAVDVGHGQFDQALAADTRVVSMEGTDIRDLTLPQPVDGAAVDVSFISLRRVLPSVIDLVGDGGEIIMLVKPQFEAGRAHVGKGGVVKDPAAHERVLRDIAGFCGEQGLSVMGLIPSPIQGRGGNREYLLYCLKGKKQKMANYDIRDVITQSFSGGGANETCGGDDQSTEIGCRKSPQGRTRPGQKGRYDGGGSGIPR